MSRTIILPLLWFMIRNKISVTIKITCTSIHYHTTERDSPSFELLSLSKVQELQGIFSTKFGLPRFFTVVNIIILIIFIAIISSKRGALSNLNFLHKLQGHPMPSRFDICPAVLEKSLFHSY